jgi:hypothetical protein
MAEWQPGGDRIQDGDGEAWPPEAFKESAESLKVRRFLVIEAKSTLSDCHLTITAYRQRFLVCRRHADKYARGQADSSSACSEDLGWPYPYPFQLAPMGLLVSLTRRLAVN